MNPEIETQESEAGKENQLCREWQKRLKSAEKMREDAVKRWDKQAKYMAGRQHDDGKGGLVRANLLYMTAYKLRAMLYAKNPEIAVQPNTGVDDQAPEAQQRFAATLERVINRQLLDGKLKKRAKGAIMAALTKEVGWVKVGFQRDYHEDPDIRSRISDTQDNLAKLQSLMDRIEDGEEGADVLEARQLELNELLRSLEEQVEVEVASGIVIDKVARGDLVYDPSVKDWDNIEQAGWMIQKIWMPHDEAKAKAPEGFKLENATTYKWADLDEEQRNDRSPEEHESAVCVRECWDRNTMTVYTWVDGVPQWFREPFTPELLGQRFFPFFGLAFYVLDGEVDPLSFVHLLMELQDEYNETRTQLREDRKEQQGYLIMDKSVDPDSVDRVKNRIGQEIVIVDAEGRPLRDVVVPGVTPNFNPAAYDTSPIRTEWEMLSGVNDAANGSVMTAKTATEAEILQEALQTVVSEMRDTEEDWLTDIAQYVAELCLLELSTAEAEQIAGNGALWPEEPSLDMAYNLVSIQIRAGSTGKPNRLREMDTWRELFPIITETTMKVRQMMMQGIDPGPEIEVLKELLARHDERIDVTRFLPTMPQQQGMPGMPGQAPMPGMPQPGAQPQDPMSQGNPMAAPTNQPIV